MESKKILITGGTGSFGKIVTKLLIKQGNYDIVIFSRDEKKQDDMRKSFNSNRIKFHIGDVRDYDSIKSATYDVDYIFHAAALKQVPSCEFHPLEATKTNVLGTENVLEAAINQGVEKVVCLSTDKSVYPINAMGISKALMEKVAIAKSKNSKKTNIIITRYGNVMGSRGSVIPLFISQVNQGIPITVTDLKMTRFMMTLQEAVNLVLYAFENGNSGDIFVQKSPACTIEVLIKAIKNLMNAKDHPIVTIGTRHGEKLYEVLLSREEMAYAEDLGNYFRVPPDLRTLNYEKYFNEGANEISISEDYNSHNTLQLSINEVVELLNEANLIDVEKT